MDPRPAALALFTFLAACTTPGEPPATTEALDGTATSPELPGILLHASGSSAPGAHNVTAVAFNVGNRTYRIQTVCETPWRERMLDEEGAEVSIRAPEVRCLALGRGDFRPGDQRNWTLTWNETRWDADGNRFEPAAAGTYTWGVAFAASRSDNETAASVEVRFALAVRG